MGENLLGDIHLIRNPNMAVIHPRQINPVDTARQIQPGKIWSTELREDQEIERWTEEELDQFVDRWDEKKISERTRRTTEEQFIQRWLEHTMREELKLKEKPPYGTAALKTQVGGDHYKNMVIQPIEYNQANGLGYCEGNVVKYVSRWRTKNGVEDLKKARHYLDVLIQLIEEGRVEC